MNFFITGPPEQTLGQKISNQIFVSTLVVAAFFALVGGGHAQLSDLFMAHQSAPTDTADALATSIALEISGANQSADIAQVGLTGDQNSIIPHRCICAG